MTYTIVTEDGLIMYREDIFPTLAEAEAYVAANPFTPSGHRQLVADTATAKLINAECKAARVRHALALDIERKAITSRILHNAAVSARDAEATRNMISDMERDGLL